MRARILAGWMLGVIGLAAAQPKKADVPAPKDSALRAELVARMAAEQDARVEMMRVAPPNKVLSPEDRQRPEVKAAAERMEKVDRDNLAWLKGVVEKRGWPGKALVGTDGALGAFLIAQHAVSDLDFMSQSLASIKEAYKTGDAEGQWIALMTDRLLVLKDKKKQLYGTQLMAKDGKLVPQPIEDEANVDARRRELGMPPLADYLKMVNEPPAAKPTISAERMKADVAFLASDRLEGRGPGTRGEELTTEFLAAEFKKAGLAPAGERGTYFQPVPLLRVVTDPKATLRASKGTEAVGLRAGDDFSGTSHTQAGDVAFAAEAVFVGHGITAPEFGWDDYAGIDVKDKVVVLFTNEPPSDDPKFFGGRALTYYGRWTYKFEEAARRGAKACLIIHTNETAGYPYSVVRPLDGAQLPLERGEPALAFAGWLTRAAGDRVLALAGKTVEAALKEADTKGFKSYPLGVSLKGDIPTRVEKFRSNNVVGVVEGSDPALKGEAVLFTAHWDHLGVGRAVVGDNIYNGAADNATGCALLLEIARAWAARTPKPKRSAVFLAVTAEEKGLLGSKYYAQHPLIPLGKTALDVNFDMILPLGVPESVVVNGAERTTAWPTVKAVAARHGLAIEPDPRAHVGIYYRSDHFSLARAGVPGFSVAAGTKLKGKPADFARQAVQEFNDRRYHSPQDEVQPDWDFRGFEVLARFAQDVAREAANADRLPTWNPGDEFRPAREKSGVK